MEITREKQQWEAYCARERERVLPFITSLGYILEEYQPHISGERYLMQALTTASGKKLILLGRRMSNNLRVVIKVTTDQAGMEEIEHERICRETLNALPFTNRVFPAPEEILTTKRDGILISIQRFIEQDLPFLERPIEEQFAYALGAYKAQESTRATTYAHWYIITRTFGSKDAVSYERTFAEFDHTIRTELPHDSSLAACYAQAKLHLTENKEHIEQYCGFLTHTDFVPHNFRIAHDTLYLLDHSSIRFGNKHEGWARFVNFMALYNPPLEKACIEYLEQNRTPEECASFQAMRVYRLTEIITYYVRTLPRSIGNLHALNEARVLFWSDMLRAVLQNERLSQERIEQYVAKRDHLRDRDEQQRQVGLH